MTAYRLPRDISDYPPSSPVVASTNGFFATPAWHGWVAAFVIAGLAVAFILLRILAAIRHHLPIDHTHPRPPLTRHQHRALAPPTFYQRIKGRLKRLIPQPLRSRLFPASGPTGLPTTANGTGIGNAGNANGQRQVGQGEIRSNESVPPAYSAPPSYTTEPTPVRFWMSNRFRRLFTNPLHRFSNSRQQQAFANASAMADASAQANANMNINFNHDLERLERRQTAELAPSQTATIILTSSLPQLNTINTTPPRSHVIQPEIGTSRTTARRSSITWAALSSVPPEPPPHYSYPNVSNPTSTPPNPSDSNHTIQSIQSTHTIQPGPPNQAVQVVQANSPNPSDPSDQPSPSNNPSHPNQSNQSNPPTHSTSQMQEVEMAEMATMATMPSTANPTS